MFIPARSTLTAFAGLLESMKYLRSNISTDTDLETFRISELDPMDLFCRGDDFWTTLIQGRQRALASQRMVDPTILGEDETP